jgi:hypothetical protein
MKGQLAFPVLDQREIVLCPRPGQSDLSLVQSIDIALVMLVVMDLESVSADHGLEREIGIGQRRQLVSADRNYRVRRPSVSIHSSSLLRS